MFTRPKIHAQERALRVRKKCVSKNMAWFGCCLSMKEKLGRDWFFEARCF